jgi:hypothetical protein
MITEIPNPVKLKQPKFTCDRLLSDKIPAPFPNHSGFFICISGAPGSGKTTLAMSTLLGVGKQRCYRGIFQNIFIVCPPSSLASMEKNPFQDHPPEKIFSELSLEAMDQIETMAMEAREDDEFSLLLIDDVSADLKNKEVKKVMQRLCLNRRHKNLPIILLSQSLNLIPLTIRKSFSHIFLYKFLNKKELDNVYAEMITLDRKKADALMRYVYQDKHDHLMIDINLGKYYRNLNELVIDDD